MTRTMKSRNYRAETDTYLARTVRDELSNYLSHINKYVMFEIHSDQSFCKRFRFEFSGSRERNTIFILRQGFGCSKDPNLNKVVRIQLP